MIFNYYEIADRIKKKLNPFVMLCRFLPYLLHNSAPCTKKLCKAKCMNFLFGTII